MAAFLGNFPFFLSTLDTTIFLESASSALCKLLPNFFGLSLFEDLPRASCFLDQFFFSDNFNPLELGEMMIGPFDSSDQAQQD